MSKVSLKSKIDMKRIVNRITIILKSKFGIVAIIILALFIVYLIGNRIYQNNKIKNAQGDLQYMQIAVYKVNKKGINEITKTYYFEDNHVYYQKEGKKVSRYYSVSETRIQKLNKKIEEYILGKPAIKEDIAKESYIYGVLYQGNMLYVYDEASYILPKMDLAKDIAKVLK